MAMVPFHTRCPEVGARETRSLAVLKGADTPEDEYGFLELYCDDSKCDCRRAVIQVLSRRNAGKVMATINIGWEPGEFYAKKFPYLPEAAKDITEGSLDPLNQQSKHAKPLLKLFQDVVCTEEYKARLQRHYYLFRGEKSK
jgi:hypothetical protein